MNKEKIFYLNGNKDGEFAIKENSGLYNWMSENYNICEDIEGNEELIFDEHILNDIQNSNKGFSQAENILIGFMLFNIEYTGGFIFK